MSEQQKKNKSATSSEEEEIQEIPTAPAETDSDVDDLLDEIDSVLEENAEEFVRGYVQKGGQ